MFLHYPLLLMFEVVPLIELVQICIITVTVIHWYIDNLEKFKPYEWSGINVNSRNERDTDLLTPFDLIFCKQYLCYLVTILNSVGNKRKVSMLAFSSYRCELYFAFLRMMSHFDNSLPKAQQVIED